MKRLGTDNAGATSDKTLTQTIPGTVSLYHPFAIANPLSLLIASPLQQYFQQLEQSPEEVIPADQHNSAFYAIVSTARNLTGTVAENDNAVKAALVKYKEDNQNFHSEILLTTPEHHLGLLHYLASKGYHNSYTYLCGQGFQKAPSVGFIPRHIAMLQRNYDFTHKEITHPLSVLLTSRVSLFGIEAEVNDLHMAILDGDPQEINMLFKHHPEVSSDVVKLGNVLHLAILFNRESIVPLLVQQRYGSNKNLRQLLNECEHYHQMTPLALAAELGRINTVEYILSLLDNDISLAANTEMLSKAFIKAALARRDEVIKLFFQHGFKPTADREYNQMIRELHRLGYEDIITILGDMQSGVNKVKYKKPIPLLQVYQNLICSGGGMKGAIYPYALKALIKACESRKTWGTEKWHLHEEEIRPLGIRSIKRVLGVSAGGIFALGFAIQSEVDRLIALTTYDFGLFLDTPALKNLSDNVPTELMPWQSQLVKWIEGGDETLKEVYRSANAIKSTCDRMGGFGWRDILARWMPSDIKSLYDNAVELKSKLPQLLQKIKTLDTDFKGLSEGKAIHDWLIQFMKDQGIENPETFTFGDLATCVKLQPEKYRHLYITVMCLDTGAPFTLSSESNAEINPCANYVILYAVEASLAIPFVITPKRLCQLGLNNERLWSQYRYVDGGVLRNSPITEFDQKRFTDPSAEGNPFHKEINRATLGFKFSSASVTPLQGDYTTRDFALRLASIYFNAESIIQQYEDHEYGRMIELDTGNIGTLPFRKLEPEEHAPLQKRANKAVKRYFYPEEKNIAHTMSGWGQGLFRSHDDSWGSDNDESPQTPFSNENEGAVELNVSVTKIDNDNNSVGSRGPL